ncbi:uncharacterized protein MELLADRAFT_111939 [Melampsora larici-populina 98AG31]|uniref:FAT domain-containing protein n=1 Tax=Melampsora larici-populina (strain 98AG31 / pathotype 3-4-7) TaxID=747676 RepID=F4S4V4_MELLP|nr:uncharacterized protein MELLADRAFT_111939 [Melampsora larici-populina 98AG31]EGG00363.1 hypothetical protein MELLADRAFT_111939 [Melampsora larici-populina 98AG31]
MVHCGTYGNDINIVPWWFSTIQYFYGLFGWGQQQGYYFWHSDDAIDNLQKLDLLLAKVDTEGLKWLFFCMSELACECQDNVSVDQLDGKLLPIKCKCKATSNQKLHPRQAIWQLDIKHLTIPEALQFLEEGRAIVCKDKEGATYGKLSLWLAQVSERQEEKSPDKLKSIALFYIDALTYFQDTPGLIFKVVSYWSIVSSFEEACFPMLTKEMKQVPSHKFIPVIPQLCELLHFPEAGFKMGLMEILTRLSEDHHFHSVMTLLYHAKFEPGIELDKQAGNPSDQSL